MTTYTIETGIPAPEQLYRRSPPKSPIRTALEQLELGQSFLMDTPDEYERARSMCCNLGERKFIGRKVAGQGWRMWRIA
jgi:hypothetical protein